jgi:hypothetical protein
MRKEIKYIGFYDLPDSRHQRASCPAATDKMDYICDVLQRIGYDVHIISPSGFLEPDAGWAKQSTVQLGAHKNLTLCPSVGTKRKWSRNLKVILSLLWLFFYLVLHVRKREKILVYHSPWLSLPIRWAKRIKGFELILEVEEIYGDVSSLHPYFDVMETRMLRAANSYVFSTELLAKKVGDSKPYCILYGIYRVPGRLSEPVDGDTILLLYAGVIDTHKRGAFNAIESTRYLPSGYVMHVIGFGDTDKLCRRIDELNRSNDCKIFFDGMKNGKDYLSYCQSCHIGLSTQAMDGKYLETSFPSKVLSYLCMGLRVVSCRVDCVEKSRIHPLVEYYNEDTPEAIAQAIRSVDLTKPFDTRSVIDRLDERFMKDMGELVEQM